MGDFIMSLWLKFSYAFKCKKKMWWESDVMKQWKNDDGSLCL